MKNKRNYIIAILSLLFVSLSCTKLDTTPYSSIESAYFFRNEDEVMLSVGRAYANLRGIMNRWGAGSMNLITSGECIIPFRETNLWWDNGVWIDLYSHHFASSNLVFENAWDFCFNGVTTCNQIIAQLDESPVEFSGKDNIISEVKILRAFYYYNALDWFGNIPISTDFKDSAVPKQSTPTEVFSFLEEDIKDNLSNLFDFTTPETYGRVSKAMAYTLLMKLYLNSVEWTGQERWDDVISCSDSIINMSHYELENDYFNNFSVNNEMSLENIFVIPFDKTYTEGWDEGLILHCWTLHSLSAATFNFSAFTWDGYAATEELYDSYSPNDSRINSWLVGPQYSSSGQPLMLAPNRQLTYRPHINSLFDNSNVALLDDGVRFKKYEYEPGLVDGQSMSNDWVVYRYSDILLMKAEALLRKNSGVPDDDVLGLMNKVRFRAYGNHDGDFTSATLTYDSFLGELGREFAWENHRRRDLLRFGKWNEPWFGKEQGDDHLNLFPIPDKALDVNRNLKPNPGY